MAARIEHPVVLLGRMYHAEGEQLLASGARVEILEGAAPEQVARALEGASGLIGFAPNRQTALAVAKNV